jgi:hypothetical protein
MMQKMLAVGSRPFSPDCPAHFYNKAITRP